MTEEVAAKIAVENTGKVFTEFKKNPTLVYLFVFSILFFVALYMLNANKNEQITELRTTIKLYEQRNNYKDSIIMENNKIIGKQQAAIEILSK